MRLYERLGYEIEALAMDKPIEPDPGAGRPAGRRSATADGEVVPTLRGERSSRCGRSAPGDREALLEVLRDPTVAAVWDTRGAEISADELLAGDEGWTV